MGNGRSNIHSISKILSELISIQLLITVAYLSIKGFNNATLVHLLVTEITIIIALILPVTIIHTGMINGIIVTLREFYDEYKTTVKELRTATRTLDNIIEKSLDSMDNKKD